jgi:hypothetical protein
MKKLPTLAIKDIAHSDVVEIDKSRLVEPSFGLLENLESSGNVKTRSTGNFSSQAIYLNSNYDWVLGKDDRDEIILVPLRKF